MAEVIIQESESLENALRRFKRKVQQEDIIKEIKKHSFYMKPGEKRRAKEALSRKRLRKKQRREAGLDFLNPRFVSTARRRTSGFRPRSGRAIGIVSQIRRPQAPGIRARRPRIQVSSSIRPLVQSPRAPCPVWGPGGSGSWNTTIRF